MLGRMALVTDKIESESVGMTMLMRKRWVRLRFVSGKFAVPTSMCIHIDPCSIRHLEFFPNPQALVQKYSSKDPKLILAVPASLSYGPSRQLFCDFAAIPDNVVLLTGRSDEGTLGRKLFDMWNESQRPETKWDNGKIGSNIMMDEVLILRVRR